MNDIFKVSTMVMMMMIIIIISLSLSLSLSSPSPSSSPTPHAGEEAIKARNVFYYLTYTGAVDLESISDPQLRKVCQSVADYLTQDSTLCGFTDYYIGSRGSDSPLWPDTSSIIN